MNEKQFPALFFGKLPAFGDFIRHNSAIPEITALDEWIRKGLYFAKNSLRRELDSAYRDAATYHLVFFPDNSQRALVGTIRPGQDRSGRKYPFISAVLIDQNRFNKKLLPFIPVIFKELFFQTCHFAARAENDLEQEDLIQRMETITAPIMSDYSPLIEPYHDYLKSRTLSALFKGLWKNFEDHKKFLLFRNLTEILLPLQHFKDPSHTTLGLKFPINCNKNLAGFEITFWLNVSYRLLGISETKVFYFWTVPDEKRNGNFYLFFRRPSPSFFLHLLKPGTRSENICDLAKEGPEDIETILKHIPPALHLPLKQPDICLNDFLEELKNLLIT